MSPLPPNASRERKRPRPGTRPNSPAGTTKALPGPVHGGSGA